MRKPPDRHQVKSHTRRGKTVTNYVRGSGEHATGRPRRVVGRKVFDQNTDMGVHAWTVNFTYDNPSVKGETVLVFADSYDGVIDEAFDERQYKHLIPTATELIDPSLGQIIGAVKKGAKKAAGLGAKYSITTLKAASRAGAKAGKLAGGTAMNLGRSAVKYGSYKVTTKYVEVLLQDAYGPRGPRRTAARYSLKKKYPDIWDMTNLSVDR